MVPKAHVLGRLQLNDYWLFELLRCGGIRPGIKRDCHYFWHPEHVDEAERWLDEYGSFFGFPRGKTQI